MHPFRYYHNTHPVPPSWDSLWLPMQSRNHGYWIERSTCHYYITMPAVDVNNLKIHMQYSDPYMCNYYTQPLSANTPLVSCRNASTWFKQSHLWTFESETGSCRQEIRRAGWGYTGRRRGHIRGESLHRLGHLITSLLYKIVDRPLTAPITGSNERDKTQLFFLNVSDRDFSLGYWRYMYCK